MARERGIKIHLHCLEPMREDIECILLHIVFQPGGDEDATLTPAMKEYLKKRSAAAAAAAPSQDSSSGAGSRRPDDDPSLFSL